MAHYKPESQIEQLGTSINKQLHERLKSYSKKTAIPKRIIINDALLQYFIVQDYQQDLLEYCDKRNISVDEAIELAIKKLLGIKD